MDNQKFGAFLCALRKEKGWTQAQLAQKLNVTDKAISKWERGAGFPDIKLLEPLADALGVSLLELMHAERIPGPEVPTQNAEQAVSNLLDTADLQQKIERRNLILICGGTVAAVMLVFLVDALTWTGFFWVYLPIAALLTGSILLAIGLHSRRQGRPFRLLLAGGGVMLLYPVCILLLLFFAFPLGALGQR